MATKEYTGPDGQIYSIDEANHDQAVNDGFKPRSWRDDVSDSLGEAASVALPVLTGGIVNPAISQETSEYFTTKEADESVRAGLEGVARGATFGMSDRALTGPSRSLEQTVVDTVMTGGILPLPVQDAVFRGAQKLAGIETIEDQAEVLSGMKQRREDNQAVSMAGELAGGFLIPGSNTLRGNMALGGAYGLGGAISEAALDNKPLMVEQAVISSGASAAAGGLFHGVGVIGKKIFEKFSDKVIGPMLNKAAEESMEFQLKRMAPLSESAGKAGSPMENARTVSREMVDMARQIDWSRPITTEEHKALELARKLADEQEIVAGRAAKAVENIENQIIEFMPNKRMADNSFNASAANDNLESVALDAMDDLSQARANRSGISADEMLEAYKEASRAVTNIADEDAITNPLLIKKTQDRYINLLESLADAKLVAVKEDAKYFNMLDEVYNHIEAAGPLQEWEKTQIAQRNKMVNDLAKVVSETDRTGLTYEQKVKLGADAQYLMSTLYGDAIKSQLPQSNFKDVLTGIAQSIGGGVSGWAVGQGAEAMGLPPEVKWALTGGGAAIGSYKLSGEVVKALIKGAEATGANAALVRKGIPWTVSRTLTKMEDTSLPIMKKFINERVGQVLTVPAAKVAGSEAGDYANEYLGEFAAPLRAAYSRGADQVLATHMALVNSPNGDDYLSLLGLSRETPDEMQGLSERATSMVVLDDIKNRQDAQVDTIVNKFLDESSDLYKPSKISVESFNTRMKSIDESLADPASVFEKLSRELPNMDGVTNDMGNKMIQIASFLKSKAPTNPYSNIPESVRPSWKPTQTDLSSWFRYVEAIEDPMRSMSKMADGQYSRETKEVMEIFYPEIYNDFKMKISQKMVETKQAIPYSKRLALSKMFGTDILGISQPQMGVLQASFMSTPESGKNIGRPSSKSKDITSAMTQAQRITAR